MFRKTINVISSAFGMNRGHELSRHLWLFLAFTAICGAGAFASPVFALPTILYGIVGATSVVIAWYLNELTRQKALRDTLVLEDDIDQHTDESEAVEYAGGRVAYQLPDLRDEALHAFAWVLVCIFLLYWKLDTAAPTIFPHKLDQEYVKALADVTGTPPELAFWFLHFSDQLVGLFIPSGGALDLFGLTMPELDQPIPLAGRWIEFGIWALVGSVLLAIGFKLVDDITRSVDGAKAAVRRGDMVPAVTIGPRMISALEPIAGEQQRSWRERSAASYALAHIARRLSNTKEIANIRGKLIAVYDSELDFMLTDLGPYAGGPRKYLRRHLILALALIPDPSLRATLIDSLKRERSKPVKSASIALLARLGRSDITIDALLATASSDSELDIREAAARAIFGIGYNDEQERANECLKALGLSTEQIQDRPRPQERAKKPGYWRRVLRLLRISSIEG